MEAERHPPVIGVAAAREPARWAVWEMPAALVASNYLEAVEAAGAVPLLVPPSQVVTAHPDAVLERIDGLLLTGGPDIDPAGYDQAMSPDTEDVSPERDAPEVALVRRAYARDIPVLGICRGMQVINVAFGGSLWQHLPERVGHDGHRRQLGTFDGIEHEVALAPDSLIAGIAGSESAVVRSHHHQAVRDLGAELRITAWSADGVPEALESARRGSYLLGVQWHPEADPESGVIASLVTAAASSRQGRDPSGGR